MKLSGKCLCGAVSFSGEGGTEAHACHCGNCRAWNGGPVLMTEIRDLAVEGEDGLKAYPSSDWAERVFCAECGSHLFWRSRDGGVTLVAAAGLDQAGGMCLAREIYIDRKPASYDFAGAHERLTEQEFLESIGQA